MDYRTKEFFQQIKKKKKKGNENIAIEALQLFLD